MAFDIAAFLRAEKTVKSIAWMKLIISIILAVLLTVIAVGFNSILATIRKSMSASSQHKFSIIFVLFIVFLICYAVCSFVLIIGSVNHDRLKVFIFLLGDTFLTGLLSAAFYGFFFSFLSTLLLAMQLMFECAVVLFFLDLRREHERRVEGQEARRRTQDQEQGLKAEIERYHARIKKTEERKGAEGGGGGGGGGEISSSRPTSSPN